MKLSVPELELMLSSLRADTLGTYGSDRQERIDKLMAKLKRERVK
jgi:hypothetical protein